LDLSGIIGQFTTQIRVGQYDLQFSLGKVHFLITSPISLVREGAEIGRWNEGSWPDPAFFEVMNVNLSRYEIPDDRTIVLYLENGVEIHLSDDSDQYECIQISVDGNPSQTII